MSAGNACSNSIPATPAWLEDRWPLCEKVARRHKKAGLAGRSLHLKLKTADFKLISRSRRLPAATQMAEEIYRAVSPLVQQEAVGRAFRLIGVGAAEFVSAEQGDLPALLDPARDKRVRVERAIAPVRETLGDRPTGTGRAPVHRPA